MGWNYFDMVRRQKRELDSHTIMNHSASCILQFYRMDALRNSDYPPHKKLIKNYNVKTIPELTQLVQQNKFAVTVEMLQHGTLSYQSFLDKESSKHYMIMNPMYWQNTIVMSSKTWPFMEQLNRIVFMQQESGIRYYWEYLVNAAGK